jgi:hypothetical protein
MILNESDQSVLVSRFCAEMKPDALGRVALQAVVQPFVVAEVESLLLQLPFEVPVGLGDELELRMVPFDGRDDRRPVIG